MDKPSKRAIWKEIRDGLGTLHVHTTSGDIYHIFSRDPSQLIPEEHIHGALAAWGYQDYPIEKETN